MLAARRAIEHLDAIGTWCNDTHVYAGCAEVLHAAGEEDLARRALAAAVAQVEARAACIDDPRYTGRASSSVSRRTRSCSPRRGSILAAAGRGEEP